MEEYFRINVRRGVPDEILSSNEILRFPQFKKIHFFLTIDRTQICEFESQNFIGCRSLIDEAIWNEYLHGPTNNAPSDGMKGYLGYQWTASALATSNPSSSAGVKDLVVLGRFSTHRSSVRAAMRFVILGLIFGMIGNALWDIFKPADSDYWSHLLQQRWAALGVFALLLVCVVAIWPSKGKDR